MDADPYRDGVRDAVVANDRAKIAELAKQDAALEQPPGFVAFLGEIQAIAVERRGQLLQAAVSRRSGDLGLLMTLGRTYGEFQKDTANERLRWYQAAVAAAPANVAAHTCLGNALYHKGQMDEAIACYKKTIELDPKLAFARVNLAQAERLTAARDKLAAFQDGSYAPATSAERLGLAEWCQIKKLYHTAAGLYAAAFAAESKLADDHRYNAACFAALAAAGQGEDAAKLDDNERTRLRKQALDWLKADLAARGSRVQLRPARGPIGHRGNPASLAEGHRPGRFARIGDPGQTPGGREEGIYAVVGRRDDALEKGGGEAKIATMSRRIAE